MRVDRHVESDGLDQNHNGMEYWNQVRGQEETCQNVFTCTCTCTYVCVPCKHKTHTVIALYTALSTEQIAISGQLTALCYDSNTTQPLHILPPTIAFLHTQRTCYKPDSSRTMDLNLQTCSELHGTQTHEIHQG